VWADNHFRGVACNTCADIYRGLVQRHTHAELVDSLREVHGDLFNYPELPDRVSTDKITITCKEHGNFYQTYGSHKKGAGCPKCNSGLHVSKWELEVGEWLEEIGETIVRNDRILKGKEIDITIPRLNIGIELNGLYWHREEKHGKNYHVDKHNLAASLGVRLIQIFEDEWEKNKKVVKHTLLLLLGKLKKVGARELEISECTYQDLVSLYTNYHLQGVPTSSNRHFCLKLGEEIISGVSFGKSRFATGELELIRYATKQPVVGGLTRLIKAYKLVMKKGKLISYSDVRWFEGKAYLNSGFTFAGQSLPGYFWCKKMLRVNRFHFQKHKIIKIIPTADLSKTENEIAEQAGFFKVYDCGQKKWELNF
jgi:hypothetical protein